MKKNLSANIAVISICIGASQALAAADGTSGTTGAADASAKVPPTVYQSPFSNYRAMGADLSTPWKDANDTVRNIGGWQAYAKEAAEAAKAAASKSRPATAPTPPAPSSTKPPARAVPPGTLPAPQHKHGG